MYKIFNKLCQPNILNYFTLTPTQLCNNIEPNCDFIKLNFNIII